MVASGLPDASYKGWHSGIRKVIQKKVTDIEAVEKRKIFHAQF
jgi:hypothetical protein